MSKALATIRRRVKELQRKHPNMKFRTAQKQAGAEYRSGSIGATRKKKKPAVKKKRVSGVKKKTSRKTYGKSSRGMQIGSISSHKAAARKLIKQRLGETMVRQTTATKVTAKRKIGKRVAALKKELKALA